MYKYISGKEICSEEHMLSASEIAKLYGFYTVNGLPNGRLVKALIEDYYEKNGTGGHPVQYYYPCRHGVMRVYPEVQYINVLIWFICRHQHNDGSRVYTYNNIKYIYSITGGK